MEIIANTSDHLGYGFVCRDQVVITKSENDYQLVLEILNKI